MPNRVNGHRGAGRTRIPGASFLSGARRRSIGAAAILAVVSLLTPAAVAVDLEYRTAVPAQTADAVSAEQRPTFLHGLTDPGRPVLQPRDHARITAALDAHLADHDGRLAISVHEVRTGTTYAYGSEEPFTAASVVKLDLLLVLMLHAQDEKRELTAGERDLAEKMIQVSDNDTADAIHARIGFATGLAEGIRRLGLLRTVPDKGGSWGATTTTASDRIRLLRTVFSDPSPLSEENRAYVRELLTGVAPDQAWGVSAAAQEGDITALKNGWVPREADANRWTINSVGHVKGAHREYLIAVLSDRHPDYGTGIACVEHAVTEVAGAIDTAIRATGTEAIRGVR